ncbi:MAG: VirB4 family type IV secretion/conjugal transfer ATPase [Alphaproteobacteria bacterium]|nr:VirB4 family type IV secretion/conjugal transfer ATPase [Rickettsiales bacterium]
MRLFQFFKPSYKNSTSEWLDKPISDFIPYLCHYNDNVIITRSGDLLSVIKVEGFSFETADDSDLEEKKQARNNLLKGMGNADFSIYAHTVRKKYGMFPEGDFERGSFGEMLNNEWKKRHNPERTYTNEHYITILRKAPPKFSMFTKILNLLQGTYGSGKSAMMESFNVELKEMSDRVVNGLMHYKSKLLGIREENGSYYSEPLEFFSYLINLGYQQKVLLPRKPISDCIPSCRLFFADRAIEIVGPNYRKFAGIVSIKEYRPATFVGMLDGFLQLPFEFVITQSFAFIDRMSAISKMQLQQRRLVQSEDVAISQIQEIGEALDSAMSGIFAFGLHHTTVACLADNPKELDTFLSQVIVEFSNSGISAVREKTNMEPCFWAQLPGNLSYAARAATINTLNLASFASFHNYPSGKFKGNFWGNAVTVFNTTSGTPYFFNFHARDVGHTFIIGPTGAGKTVLLNFLCGQAQKFKPRTFFFDKDRGAEIFIKAIGGKHITIDPSRPCYFNPFALEDTGSNRHFLIELLSVLVSSNGKVTPEEKELLDSAVKGNYKLKPEDRQLCNIAPFLGIDIPGSIASRLKMWYGNGAKAKVFDNAEDKLDFSKGRVFGFEMAELLKDQEVLSPALLYVFHKIQSSLDGTPTMIILDEAWALIDNPVFAPKLKDWLKVLRKLNAFIIFATQSVEDAAKSAISDTLVQQTATQIFLPNLKATSPYKDVFMLSEREFDLVKHTDPASRFFLIKQDTDGVIARIDLKGMMDIINILSARADTAIILDKIISKVGSDPVEWLPIFLQKLR